MESFSQRYSLEPIKEIQINDIDTVLFNRLWNIFYREECSDNILDTLGVINVVEYLFDCFGFTYRNPYNITAKKENIRKLKKIP